MKAAGERPGAVLWICGRVLRTGASPSGRVGETVDNASALPTASPTLSRLSPTSSTGPTTSEPEKTKLKLQRTSTPITGNGYDAPEGITSQSQYTLFRPSDCPSNPDHLTQIREMRARASRPVTRA